MKPVIIARFSILLLAIQMAVSAAVLAFLCRSFLPPELFAVLAALLFGVGVYRRKAIWIENDRLFFRDTPLMITRSRAIVDVEDVALGEERVWTSALIWTHVIVIKLRGGGAHTVGQYPLKPGIHTALARLREALGPPGAPPRAPRCYSGENGGAA